MGKAEGTAEDVCSFARRNRLQQAAPPRLKMTWSERASKNRFFGVLGEAEFAPTIAFVTAGDADF